MNIAHIHTQNFNKKSPLWTFISLIPLIVQWGFILYFRKFVIYFR